MGSVVANSPWKVDGWAGYLINGSNGRKGLDVFGRATFSLPSTQVLDIRLAKMFTFNERYRLEVLGDFFNLFNHVNVTGVNNTGYIISTSGTVTGPNNTTVPCSKAAPCLRYNAPFGSVTNANSNYAYSSRQIQIGAKFYF